ncbi:hypothetical protein MUK42_11829 [Musa troglodytarum]|uniref:MTD1 n=1 Tax=Musa troglodytarum TaxID=320322 RepID=A0A9E7KGS5_9LILI|nr:hypothetical protein MUK42_11829 [Musa troglodytarum]URE16821.1 hypothetical protein MUK42_11829 [Musa troglodytarum]URE16822.1 hypothetical protein MUK42_11829 [Musa troglodytarum]URE16823.1 hypothetical protein MUK42_11829 [Musa troglodytarum]
MSSLVISSVGLKDHVSLPAYLHAEKNEEKEQTLVEVVRKRTLFCLEEEEDSSESSSIGAASSSSSDREGEGTGEEEEVESKKGEGAFGSLDSLEESLPIKRGLSNFFSGKSKSFASLSDAAANANGNELAKPENPFNKRRRILMAYKARRASYGSLVSASTYLPPLLSSDHTVPEGDEEEDERCGGDLFSLPPLPGHGNAFRSSPRSFSLSDLRHV